MFVRVRGIVLPICGVMLLGEGDLVSPVDEQARLAALHRLDILDTPPEERFDRVVRIAQRVFEVPTVAVNLIDADRQWTKAGIGMADRELPRETSFCAQTMHGQAPLVIEDASADARFRDNPLVTGSAHVRFYAGHPISTPDGQPVGALCLVDSRPRTMTSDQQEVLADLAAWVEKELALDQELTRAAEMVRLMLPRSAPYVPGYSLAGSFLPAREIGGDFYDWYPLRDGTVQFLLGDVMGKGVPAALIATSVRAVVRGASRFNPLDEAITRTAFSMAWDLDETSTFVTLFAGRLDPASGTVEYVDAGHGLTVVVDREGGYRQLVTDGMPLGAMPEDRWAAESTLLEPGETLVCASDGYLDLLGSTAACLDAVRKADVGAHDAAEVVRRLTEQAPHAPEDDLTLVVLRREAGR
jgi:serine phosphatase RsbU (regulator of sigma subunit)